MTEVVGVLTGGLAAAERAAAEKAEREKRRAASFSTWEWGQWEAAKPGEVYGESKIIRLVTDEDEWAEAKQHNFLNTKPAPKDLPEGKSWSKKRGGVCRYTLVAKRAANGEIVRRAWYDDCYACDEMWLPGKDGKPDYHPRPTPRQWAWAVEREEVLGTQEMADAGEIEPYEVGTPVGYKDVEVERKDAEGNTYLDKKWLLLNFAMENFFDKFLGYKNVHKTVVDRDYKVTRKGSSTDTDYEVIALDPIDVELDGKKVRFDLRRPEFREQYKEPKPLFDIIAEQASDEYWEWFFDARVESSWEKRFGKKEDAKGDGGSTSDTTDAPTAADESQRSETLNAMRERLKKSKEPANA